MYIWLCLFRSDLIKDVMRDIECILVILVDLSDLMGYDERYQVHIGDTGTSV